MNSRREVMSSQPFTRKRPGCHQHVAWKYKAEERLDRVGRRTPSGHHAVVSVCLGDGAGEGSRA